MAISRASDQFRLDAYTGEGGFLSGAYLQQFPREGAPNFKDRQEVAVYPNYVRKVVDIYSGFLWQREPTREGGAGYADFAANADGIGTSLNMLMQSYQRRAMLLGTVYILVDRPQGEALTKADEKLPYLVMREPSALVDYRTDGFGRFEWCVFSEVVDQKTQEIRYRRFDAATWRVSSDPGGQSIIEQGEHKLGRVPVARLHSTLPLLPTDIRAQAWIHDLAQLNWDLFNQVSELRMLFRQQVFAMLKLPAKDDAERERLQNLAIGPNNALSYDPTDGGEPGFIAPPPDPVKAYQDNITATIERIYQMANLEFVGGVQQSGVALSFHFQEANRTLGLIAALTEQAERDIAALVAAWQGGKWGGNIAYARDFNLVDLAETLKQGMEAIQLEISPTFDAELKKRLARQVLGHGVAQATLSEIDQEITAGGDPYMDRIQQAAGATA